MACCYSFFVGLFLVYFVGVMASSPESSPAYEEDRRAVEPAGEQGDNPPQPIPRDGPQGDQEPRRQRAAEDAPGGRGPQVQGVDLPDVIPSYLPTEGEIDNINANGGHIIDILGFSGLDGAVAVAVLDEIGLKPDDHYSAVGSVHPDEFEAMLTSFKFEDRPLKLGQKGQLRMF